MLLMIFHFIVIIIYKSVGGCSTPISPKTPKWPPNTPIFCDLSYFIMIYLERKLLFGFWFIFNPAINRVNPKGAEWANCACTFSNGYFSMRKIGLEVQKVSWLFLIFYKLSENPKKVVFIKSFLVIPKVSPHIQSTFKSPAILGLSCVGLRQGATTYFI